MEIKVLKDIFASNESRAEEIRSLLREKKVYMADFMSSPGSGKTTLLDSVIGRLKDRYRIALIEGDIKTTRDAERLAVHGIPIVQIETSLFGGDCHLESSWIRKCLDDFDLETEQYWVLHDDLIDVLATTTHPVQPCHPWHRPLTSPAVWTRRWGAGRIFVATPGHSLDVLRDADVRTIIERGMLWASSTESE